MEEQELVYELYATSVSLFESGGNERKVIPFREEENSLLLPPQKLY